MIAPTGASSANYRNAVKNGSPVHCRLVFPTQNITLTDDDIEANGGLRITTMMNPDTDLIFGKAVMSELVVHLINSSVFDGFDWTEEFHVDFSAVISGTEYWATVGYFKGKKPERTVMTEIIEFTAYDRMQYFDVLADDFIDSLGDTFTLTTFYANLCFYVGLNGGVGDRISQAMSTTFSKSILPRGVTCRTLLAWVAEANCCYAVANQAGNITLRWFYDMTGTVGIYDDFGYTEDQYYNIDISENQTTAPAYFRMVCTDGTASSYVYPVTTGEKYEIYDNPFLLNLPSSKYSSVIGTFVTRMAAIAPYRAIMLRATGCCLYQAGDMFNVYYNGGSDHIKLPVFNMVLYFNGGCSNDFECTGNTNRQQLNQSAQEQYSEGGKIAGAVEKSAATKYTIVSGVDIDDDGVTVSGGKYVKIISGGIFDVQSTNFVISSTDKKMQCGNWTFSDGGLIWKDTTVANGNMTEMDIRRSSNEIHFSMNLKGYGDTYGFKMDGADSGSLIPFANSGIVLAKLGNVDNQWARIYAQLYYGDGVKNNLTTSSAGYVLDARQGKALKDQIANVKQYNYVVSANSTVKLAFRNGSTKQGNSVFLVTSRYNAVDARNGCWLVFAGSSTSFTVPSQVFGIKTPTAITLTAFIENDTQMIKFENSLASNNISVSLVRIAGTANIEEVTS